MANGNFIRQAREAARRCPDRAKREALQRCTDDLHDVFGRFTTSCSKADMVELVGAWTRVAWAIEALPPVPEHGPGGAKQRTPDKGKLTNAA